MTLLLDESDQVLIPFKDSRYFMPTERLRDEKIDRPYQRNPQLRPDGAPEETLWPSGFICPFHFDNPATGRKALK